MDIMDRVVDQLVVSRCRNIEYEVEHHVSRSGPQVARGLMVRPTQEEFGITALVTWGMIQLAKTIEASGQTVEEWSNG